MQISGYSLVHIMYRENFVILWDVKRFVTHGFFHVYFSNYVTYGGGAGGGILGLCGPPG